jgi:hypothetical protein
MAGRKAAQKYGESGLRKGVTVMFKAAGTGTQDTPFLEPIQTTPHRCFDLPPLLC